MFDPHDLRTLHAGAHGNLRSLLAHCRAIAIDDAGAPLDSAIERYKEHFWQEPDATRLGGRALFLRLRQEQETTSTFKFRKVELKQEGFDPAKVNEPLYVLTARDGSGYQMLSPDLFRRIQEGSLRF